ncbi:L-rhamnose mutarotase [Autumnicola musiva]|uniref:L-rhamnose mutarotase n=1 Tax=Autumnicola musiva TaxID=3075589 RepID=A0ABU3D2V7_9FLAO|nr:L-rhamnose mutarotase [Zunongwangia sp. F117]MDT0675869.1 L-rhamnose mutarotase [Zunongwangia sp. F117]
MKHSKKIFVLDLKDNPHLIAEYLEHHKNVWPEVLETFELKGIEEMEVYHVYDRLVMVININENYDGSDKNLTEKAIAITDEWEKLMWKYQKAVPEAKKGQKWVEMKPIFKYPKF